MKITRPEIVFKSKGGIMDAVDDAVKSALNITDEEFDYICTNATDEDMSTFADFVSSEFSKRKKALVIRNKYLALYKEEIKKPDK